MTGFLFTGPKFQGFDNNGYQLSGGKLYSYIAGTTTPTPTYPTKADADAATNANTNPIILDSRGEASVYPVITTKFVLTTADDVVIWTVDNVPSTTGATGPAGPAGSADAILGDGTSGLILRKNLFRVKDGTNANTIKCYSNSAWNGSSFAEEDNIGKGLQVVNFSLDAAGSRVTMLNSAFLGTPVAILSSEIIYNSGGEDVTLNAYVDGASNNDVKLYFRHAITGAVYDLTANLVGSSQYIEAYFLYLTL